MYEIIALDRLPVRSHFPALRNMPFNTLKAKQGFFVPAADCSLPALRAACIRESKSMQLDDEGRIVRKVSLRAVKHKKDGADGYLVFREV